VEIKQFLAGISVVSIGILGAHLFSYFLKVYQKKRLVVFLDPYLDPLGSGYNIIQSKIAVGSGALAGKGLLYGTQSRLGFLPEQHTDFIFSVLAEQFGFIGSALLVLLLFVIVWRGIIIATQARDEFGALVASGIVTMFTFHIFLNIGMTLGMMPITGIPLPLVSYGGSSLVMNMFAIGILLNIRMKRFFY
jgi:rod shape determining protein RodA